MRLVTATVVLMGLLATSAMAAAPKAWDFGRLAFGKEVPHPPKWSRHLRCDEDGGCGFEDSDGIQYRTWASWNYEVVNKEITLRSTQRYLPFGIKREDAWQIVVTKVQATIGLKLQCQTHAENSNIDPGERFCSAEVEPKSDISLDFLFGKDGKLKTISLFTDYT